MRKPTRSRSPEAFVKIPLTGENSTGVPAADSSSRPPERTDYSPSSLAPPRVLVYQRLLSFLQDVSRAMNPSIASTLDEHHSTMSATDTVSALVKSRESRAALLQAASHLGISSDPNLREALNEDETRIATHVLSILDSQTTKEAILLLEGDSAQHFLDVIQHILDRGLLIEQEYNAKARRMILKLSEACDKLPSSLFITGVSGRDHDATFGGGFGDIFQASYGGKTVALKRMRTFHRGPELRRIRLQFCREALIWQDLKHPYILPMLGIDRESFPSSLCMVSPWMENGTVLNYLEEHGRKDVDRLLWEVAQGLEYLHSRNIVHGDLRGANILITQDCTSHQAGTARWMAPELIAPDHFGIRYRRTPASDVYAFACVCLELYTGQPPFADIREMGVVLKIVQGERPTRPATTPPMSDALWNYVNTWWAENPTTRPTIEVVVRTVAKTQPSDHTNPIEDTSNRDHTGVPAAHSSLLPAAKGPDYSPSNPLESVSSAIPSRIFVYQCLLSFLQEVSRAKNSLISSTLHEHHSTMSATDTVSALVKSRESRAILLQVASHLGIKSDPKLRKALHDDETRIATHLISILGSQTAKEAVFVLEGDSAQHFLDVIQHTLDRGLLIGQEHNSKAQRMMIKLSNACDKFPTSLFITGVSGRDDHATFGGGFGDIYRASYEGRTVALKQMRSFYRGSDLRRIRSKFCREALIWQQFEHPYILPMLGLYRERFSPSICMVSPWMENGTVLTYLEEHGRQDVDKFLWQIAQGLEYLHSRNIVHGDLRGVNILITQDRNACLADFDLTSFTEATATSRRAGTLRWMAPELIDPDRFGIQFRRTTASDVYAFACVCLELYTGRPPFADIREGGVLKIAEGERPARPTTTPPMSDALWNYLNAWWAENPTTRPPIEVVVRNVAMTQPSDHTNPIEDTSNHYHPSAKGGGLNKTKQKQHWIRRARRSVFGTV